MIDAKGSKREQLNVLLTTNDNYIFSELYIIAESTSFKTLEPPEMDVNVKKLSLGPWLLFANGCVFSFRF